MKASILKLVYWLASLACASAAYAQDYPTQPIRLIVPFAPGGSTEVLARMLGESMSKGLGQSMVIESRPGAGGNIGAEVVAKSAPNGYTALFMHSGIVYNRLTDPKNSVDVAELVPVSHIALAASVLSMSSAIPASTFEEFVRLAKAKPGHFTYGTWGDGSPPHFRGEYISRLLNIQMLAVPYKGNGPIVTALLANEVSLCFCSYLEVKPQVEAGKIKLLAYGGSSRSPALPQLPTFMEVGLPMTSEGWFALFVPRATSAAIVNRLSAEAQRAMKAPEIRAKAAEMGMTTTGTTPQYAAEEVRKEFDLWTNILRTAGVKPR